MGNCLVAQSGGPTAVINASLAGVIKANQLDPLYERVLGGIHGIEGVLAGKLYDLTDIPESELEIEADALISPRHVPLQAQARPGC